MLRPHDLVARVGGDEFVMVFRGCDAERAESIVERCRGKLRDAARRAGLPAVTASFGLATGEAGTALEHALERADTALREAKRGGRDRMSVARVEIDLGGGERRLRIQPSTSHNAEVDACEPDCEDREDREGGASCGTVVDVADYAD